MSKLQALRELMKTAGVKAYLIPHTDEFQSEYTAPYAERLRFITGFTGSAGFAVVSAKKAAFFTDGRYTLQAQNEVKAQDFEIFNSAKTKPEDWIAENIKGKVGFDPWLMTPNQLKRYADQGLELIPLPSNLVDQIWSKDQPHRPAQKFFVHPQKFAGQSHLEKCKTVGRTIKENGAQKALITRPDSLAWLLNIRGDDVTHSPVVLGYVLLDQDGTYDVFVPLDKVDGKTYSHLSQKGRVVEIQDIDKHLNKQALKDVDALQLDPQSTPAALADFLDKAGISVLQKPDPCQRPKALKNDTEIQGMRKAHIRDGLALVKFMAWLCAQPLEGETTEWTASQKLGALRAEGEHFYDLSFDTISGYGPHGAVIHYRVTEDSALPLGHDSLYLVDSGGQYFDGTTDVTRTLCLGEPTPEQKDRYTRVLKGHIALATARFPKGTTGAQLDTLARNALWQAGLDYDHGTGHGVGCFLGVHEGPQGISKTASPVPLEPGMILSNEPGYYKEDDYGIRIESLVVVRDAESAFCKERPFLTFETITLAPLDRKLIDVRLLSESEVSWVNGYHTTIFEGLGPQLDDREREWLMAATTRL